jgi:hypothetical protein
VILYENVSGYRRLYVHNSVSITSIANPNPRDFTAPPLFGVSIRRITDDMQDKCSIKAITTGDVSFWRGWLA